MSGYEIKTLKRCDLVKAEHIEAAALFTIARQATSMREGMSHDDREAMAKRLDVGALELSNAADYFRRKPHEIELPEFLKPDGPPLPARYLRRADEALTHE
jgi:hypothetical protein